MLSVGPHAGRVGHDVSDVVLLVHTVKQVGHRARGVDAHVLPAVSRPLRLEGDGRLVPEVVRGWWRDRHTSFFKKKLLLQ